jgi:hypothetical protein
MKGATLEVLPGLLRKDSPAEVARLTGIGGWLLWKIITLWLSVAVFSLVAIAPGVRSVRGGPAVCFFYAVLSGITAYLLQAKKPGAVIVATIFSLLSGSIVWMIYFAVSRRVMYTYSTQAELERVKQPNTAPRLGVSIGQWRPGQPTVVPRLP